MTEVRVPPLDLEAPESAIERAFDEVSRICKERWDGKEGWRTSIPARRDYDSDLIIGDALGLARQALRDARQREAERSNRSALCIYCGNSIGTGGEPTPDAVKRVYEEAIAHDAVCPSNPLVAALAAAVEREQVTEERIAAMVTAATPVFQQVSRNHLLNDYEKTSNIIRAALDA